MAFLPAWIFKAWLRCPMAVAPPAHFLVSAMRLEKRSQALRGRNLTRNIQADGAPMVHQVPGNFGCQGPFCLMPSDTGVMPQKIH
jgi:hypothetical protein